MAKKNAPSGRSKLLSVLTKRNLDAKPYFILLARVAAAAEAAKTKRSRALSKNDVALMQAMGGIAKELLDWSSTAQDEDRYHLSKSGAQLAVMAMLGHISIPELPAAARHVADAVRRVRDSKGSLSITKALEAAGHKRDWAQYSKLAGLVIAGDEARSRQDGIRIIKEIDTLVMKSGGRKGGRPKKSA